MGRKTMTGRASRLQGPCVILARVCRVTARAGAVVGEHVGAGRRPIRHDTACRDAWRAALHLAPHAA